MPVYGFNNEETARKVAAKYGPSYGSQPASKGLNSPRVPAKLRFKNSSGSDIPGYGVAFCIGIIDDGNQDWAAEVKAWSDISGDSNLEDAIKFPVVNGPDPVAAGQWGVSQNRDGFQIVRARQLGVGIGDLVGPDDTLTGDNAFFMDAFSTQNVFEVVGYVASGVINQQGLYLLVKKLSAGESGVAFFYTGDSGIPAAPSKFQPNKAELEKRYFDPDTDEIKSFDPKEYEDVYNHTLSEVGKEKVIQAKKIDGAWFIDVEPCSGGA